MTYYEILEVSENASQDTIKAAYDALCIKYNPDRFLGNRLWAESKIQEIKQAYYVLSSDYNRQRYDRLLQENRATAKQRHYRLTNQISNQETDEIHTTISPANVNYSPTNYNRVIYQPPSKGTLFIARYLPTILLIAFLVIVGIIGTISSVNRPDPDDNLTPVTEPVSGTLLSGIEYNGESQITVTAPTFKSCVVKIKTPSGKNVLSFYVRKNETVTVNVPCQNLYVYFAYGHTWYGKDQLFGSKTTYSKDSNICNFEEYTFEYTLKETNDGNFQETYINQSDFK